MKAVSVDACLAEEIHDLNVKQGIFTIGSTGLKGEIWKIRSGYQNLKLVI